jgi:hypothetical protein
MKKAVFQAGVHGAHHHPVFQGGEAEVERGEQVRVDGVGHRFFQKAVALQKSVTGRNLPEKRRRIAGTALF